MNPYQHREYFDWLCGIVGAGVDGDFWFYRELLTRLFQTDFQQVRYMDDNRAANGVDLRYYFETNRYDYASNDVAPYHIRGNFYNDTKNEPCSMLEMMIAFAKLIDTQYLYAVDCRAIVWFWMMVESMGLAKFVDGSWDPHDENSEVEFILRAFNIGAFQYFGTHSSPTVLLFPIRNIQDYKPVDTLWAEMQIWFNQNYNWLELVNMYDFINDFLHKYAG